MPLTSGTRLGSYQIVGAIGAGGMGEVYRARDMRLNRDVAVKILPDSVTTDADRLGRFRREAQVLASLNHPNIAHIYDVEATEGSFLVLELVEGPTLAERIAQGPIPLAEALPIARQIAEALEAAHEQGIVHRDLKPANVKVRDDGVVKVLDFGLAKALAPDGGSASPDSMNSPTLTARATQLGVILGTAAYMAPEQARGKVVDRRADVWAFGVVLYEMLTGRRAFQGEEISDVLAAVLKETPPLDALPPDTPVSIRRLLRRCLEKDRRDRPADLSVARIEIKEALAGEPDAPPRAQPGPTRRTISLATAAVLGVALAVSAAAAAWWLKPAAPEARRTVARFSEPLPQGSNWSRAVRHVIAISPDGSHIAYTIDSRLIVRALDRFESNPIASVVDPSEVFFSPDNAWIGFFADGKLQKVAVTGGAPVPLCTCPPGGASWSGGYVWLAQDGGIFRVPDTGGTPQLVIALRDGERVSNPEVLPDGGAMLFARAVASQAWDDAEVVIEDLQSHVRTSIVRGGSDARYLPTGHIVYGRAGELFAIPFDLKSRRAYGTPISVARGVQQGGNVTVSSSVFHFDVSDTGTLIYAANASSDEFRLTWVDGAGARTPIVGEKGAYQYPRLSPDGMRLAFSEQVAGNTDVYVLDLATRAKLRVTTDRATDVSAVWSPDGRYLVFASNRNGQVNLYSRAADGSGNEQRLTTSANQQYPYVWSRDQKILFVEQDPKTFFDIWVLPMTGDRTPVRLIATPADERRPALSPDGRWLAYQSNEGGPYDIQVRAYPDVDTAHYQASAGGGALSPLWAPDGRALFFRRGSQIVRTPFSTTAGFKVAKPDTILSIGPDTAFWMSYDVEPNTSRTRFVVLISEEDPGAPEYRVVMNWFDEIKARVPSVR